MLFRSGDKSDKNETIMYVAAPILDEKQIIGSLTVAKPNKTILPFIERAQFKIVRWGALLLVLSLMLGGLFTWRFTRAIHRLRDYAIAVSQGKKAVNPTSSNDELAELAEAMQTMRSELDGKQYMQDAMHQLAHELKSPITAIQAASELAMPKKSGPKMPATDQAHFLDNIQTEAHRLQNIIQNMLGLAALEYQQQLIHSVTINMNTLVSEQISAVKDKAAKRNIQLNFSAEENISIKGDTFLLGQAINNLLENALDFSPNNSTITIKFSPTELSIQDQGTGIPDYAIDKIFDKFYSLPRPDYAPNAGKKSTGLGLNFVREVMFLHQGQLAVSNIKEGGAIARLLF